MMHGCTFRPLWHARASLSSLSVSLAWGLRQHHSFLLRPLRPCIAVYAQPLFVSAHNIRPLIVMKFIVRSTCSIMKFIVSVCTAIKISFMTSASIMFLVAKSFQCPEPQRQFPSWACISLKWLSHLLWWAVPCIGIITFLFSIHIFIWNLQPVLMIASAWS